jgi:hypothetical protein
VTDDELAAAGGAVSDRRPGGLEIGAVLLLLFGGMAGLPPWLAIPSPPPRSPARLWWRHGCWPGRGGCRIRMSQQPPSWPRASTAAGL